MTTLYLAAAIAASTTVAYAQAPMMAQEALTLLFDTQDANGDGVLSPREAGVFRELVYASFDSNAERMASS